ncbi:MAG TPA: DUF6443 domain-containing protein, partial [Bacteroidia bacterium]|nr:DUF6443 domain-containing protein [Bacteroidia bacterium]
MAQYTPSGQTYGTTLDTSLKSVNNSEYWTLNRSAGTSNVQVTLSWNRNSTNGNGYNDFKIGFWNGSKWISQGQASHTISGQFGTITSSAAVSFSGGSTTAPLVVGNSQAFSPCGVTDANYNWKMEEVLDVNGNDMKVTKVFTDQLGREIQTLRSDNTDNLVIATATAYDAYGRPAVKTLPAPACNSYLYKDGFFNASSGTVYDYTHFDQTSTLNNPDAVQSTFSNGLGNFYSNNGIDTYVATSSYPYARTEYTADPFSSVKRSAIAGDEYKMGSGHESRSYSMISGDELRFIFGYNGSSVPYSYKSSINSSDRSINTALAISSGILAEKTVSKNADGQEMISYS